MEACIYFNRGNFNTDLVTNLEYGKKLDLKYVDMNMISSFSQTSSIRGSGFIRFSYFGKKQLGKNRKDFDRHVGT
jgi:hypothetical protein